MQPSRSIRESKRLQDPASALPTLHKLCPSGPWRSTPCRTVKAYPFSREVANQARRCKPLLNRTRSILSPQAAKPIFCKIYKLPRCRRGAATFPRERCLSMSLSWGPTRRSSARWVVANRWSTRSPFDVRRRLTLRRFERSTCRRTSRSASSRFTKPTALLCLISNCPARSSIVIFPPAGQPFSASNAWYCCGGRPASFAAVSLNDKKRRSEWRRSRSAMARDTRGRDWLQVGRGGRLA